MKNRTLPNRVILSFTSPRFPYFYQKTISLSGEKLLLEYEIRNTGETPFPCLWVFHGLVRYEEDMEFFYSSDVQSFENVLDSLELGPAGEHFFLGDSRYDFTRVPPKSSRTMVKYYVDQKVKNGFCGYRYPSAMIRKNYPISASGSLPAVSAETTIALWSPPMATTTASRKPPKAEASVF